MKKSKEHVVYHNKDLETLTETLEPLNNIKLLLNKDIILESDELLIKFNYQILGNCLKKLTYDCIIGDEGLKSLVFWARAENPEQYSHIFNRMDIAHNNKFLSLINPNNSFAKNKAQWLQEVKALTDLIKHRLSAADFKTSRPIALDANDSFNLMPAVLPHFRNSTVIENCIGNIYQALVIADTVSVDANTLPTSPKIATILLLNQVIGNNLKKLMEYKYAFGDALPEATIKAIIDNRNYIAHVTAFSPLLKLQPSYFYNRYVRYCQALKEIIAPLAMQLAVEDAAAIPDEEVCETPIEQDNSPEELNYNAAHLKLFQDLQAIGLIDQAKVPNLDPEGKIFSDTELRHVLKGLIWKREFKLFSEILDNFKHYTNTKARNLINTPMRYTALTVEDEDKQRRFVDSHPDKSYANLSIEELISLTELSLARKVDEGGYAEEVAKTGGLGTVIYLPEVKLNYISNDIIQHACPISEAKVGEHPVIRDVYLLGYALKLVDWNKDDDFALKLLEVGANVNIYEGTGTTAGPLLWAAVDDQRSSVMPLLISYGADVNEAVNGKTLLQVIVLSSSLLDKIDAIRMLIEFGANPFQHIVEGGAKANLLCAIVVTSSHQDIEACTTLRAMINFIVEKYGFKAMQPMLSSKVAVVGHRGSNFIEVVNGQSASKPNCVRLINLLVGLDRSQGCELFKMVLTNNLEMIKLFLEPQSEQNQLALLQETFSYRVKVGAKVSNIGIVEFAKACCDIDVARYLIRLNLTLQKRCKDESKDEDRVAQLPIPPLAQGSAAGVVPAQPAQGRNNASTSLSAPSLSLPPLVVGAEGIQPTTVSIADVGISR